MPDYSTRPLDAGTWPDFAELVEAHNGVWGGCWCMAFHPERMGQGKSPAPTHRSWSHGLRRVRPVVRRPLGAEAGQGVAD
jgi:hypothetical protein